MRGNSGLVRRLLPWALRSLGLFLLLALAFLGVDIIGGLELMLDARPEYLVPAFFIFCLALLTRMAIWTLLARILNLGYRRLRSYVKLFLVGWSAGLGLPQGAVPVARAAVLASDSRSVGRGVIIDLADRLVQVATFLVLLIASAAYLSTESTRALWSLGIAGAVMVAAGLLLYAGARVFRGPLLQPIRERLESFEWLRTFSRDMAEALRELRETRPTVLAGVVTLAMVPPLLTITSLFLTSRSLGVPLSFPALMAAFAIVGLTTLLPISINGLGPREGILTAAVAGAGFNSEAGVALGLLWFVMQAATRLLAAISWFIDSAEPAPASSPPPRQAEPEVGSRD